MENILPFHYDFNKAKTYPAFGLGDMNKMTKYPIIFIKIKQHGECGKCDFINKNNIWCNISLCSICGKNMPWLFITKLSCILVFFFFCI